MAAAQYMDVGKYLSESWNITLKNMVVMVVASLIAMLFSLVTIGILSVPLWVGVTAMYIAAKKGKKPEIPHVFNHLSRTLPLLGAGLLLLVVVSAGMLLIVPGLIFAAWWMYTFPLIAFKGMKVFEAMRKSREIVRAKGTWMHVLFLVIVWIIGAVGAVVFRIGWILTMPIAVGALAMAYMDECTG